MFLSLNQSWEIPETQGRVIRVANGYSYSMLCGNVLSWR